MFAPFESNFLRNRSSSNTSCPGAKDFALNKQTWEGKFVLTENQFDRNEICCAEDIYNYLSNIRGVSLGALGAPGVTKGTPKIDQLPLPVKFYGSSMRGILCFNFASCELLTQ